MIDIYTERKDSKDWIFYNDLYFNLNTGNEDMSQKEIWFDSTSGWSEADTRQAYRNKYGLGRSEIYHQAVRHCLILWSIPIRW